MRKLAGIAPAVLEDGKAPGRWDASPEAHARRYARYLERRRRGEINSPTASSPPPRAGKGAVKQPYTAAQQAILDDIDGGRTEAARRTRLDPQWRLRAATEEVSHIIRARQLWPGCPVKGVAVFDKGPDLGAAWWTPPRDATPLQKVAALAAGSGGAAWIPASRCAVACGSLSGDSFDRSEACRILGRDLSEPEWYDLQCHNGNRVRCDGAAALDLARALEAKGELQERDIAAILAGHALHYFPC